MTDGPMAIQRVPLIPDGYLGERKQASAFKLLAACAATSNVTISTPGATIDGYSPVSGTDRVLLTAQTTTSQNGLWVYNGAASALTRPTDFASGSTTQCFLDLLVLVRNGTANSGFWRCTTTGAITIDTTATAWAALPIGALTNAPPTAEAFGGAGAVGASTLAARGDHVHALPNLTGDVTTAGSAATTIAAGVVTDAKAALSIKPLCRAVATANVATLSGTTTIDGVALVAGDLVLLTAQTTGSQNGPWTIAAGAWTRPAWYPSAGTAQAFANAEFGVREGTANSGAIYYITTSGAITIDTTSVAFAQSKLALGSGSVSGTLPAAQMPAHTGDVTSTAGSVALTIAANAVTNAKFRQGAATSVVGVSGGSTANVADIAASADGQFLQRSGGALSWLGGQALRTIAGATTLAATDAYVRVNASTSFTVTLPAANAFSGRSQVIAIARVDSSSNSVVIAAAGADTILLNSGSVTTIPLTSGCNYVLMSDGSGGWVLVDRNQPTYPLDILPDPFANVAMGGDLVTSTPTTGGYGKVTMWKGVTTGGITAATLTQGSSIGRLGTSCKWATVTSNAAATVGVYLYIPASDAAQLVNKSLTFMMSISTDATTPTWNMSVDYATAPDNFTTVTNIGTFSNTYAGSGAVGCYVPNMGACGNGVRIYFYFAANTVTTKNYEFADALIYNGFVQHDASNTGIQAKLGSYNTVDFPVLAHDVYRDRVQAWYEKSFPEATAPANNLSGSQNYFTGTTNGSGNSYFGTVWFKSRKHAGRTPTITFYNPNAVTAGTWRCYNASAGFTDATMVSDIVSEVGFTPVTSAAANLTLGVGNWVADSRF